MKNLIAVVLLLGFVSTVLAQKPRVWSDADCDGYGKDCTIELKEGLVKEVRFRLEEPIICPSRLASQTECVVVVNISNSHPEWIAINPCRLRWTPQDWHQEKAVTITAVQDYEHVNADRQVHLETQVTGSLSELYRGYDPEDLYIESVKKQFGSAQCRATGDPHYTTFDGKYWHYYDGNRRRPTRVTMYKSTTRDFVVQAQVLGHPAVACGIAGREGKDKVVISRCSGRYEVEADFHTTKVDDQPRIDVSGSTYTVYFKSGAWMRFSGGSGVYVESVDPNESCGMCGNFDRDPNNDVPGYVIQDYGSLYECQKVCTKSVDSNCQCKNGRNSGTGPSCDIWDYTPQEEETSDEKVPAAKKFCPYEPTFLKPLIGAQDVEDITDFLKQHTEEEEKRQGTFVFDTDQGNFVVADKYDDAKSLAECKAEIDTNMVVECKKLNPGGEEFSEKYDDVLQDCAEDYSNMGGPATEEGLQELKDSKTTLENGCIELFIKYGHRNCNDDSCIKLKNALCPQECSGNGQCNDAACQCSNGWAGKACSVRTDEPPVITKISSNVCDTHSSNCPDEILVTGTGFYCEKGCNSDDNDIGPLCLFEAVGDAGGTSVPVPAVFVGEDSVLCPVPRADGFGRHRGAEALLTKLSVSNDGGKSVKLFTDQKFDFTFFDSECTLCDDDANCEANPKTCQIPSGENGAMQCFRVGQVDPRLADGFATANPCLECRPQGDASKFIYVFDKKACRPIFDEGQVYDYKIYGKYDAGPLDGLVIDAASNAFVNAAPGYKVTYSVQTPPSGNDAQVEAWFDIDENTGQVLLKKGVDISVMCNNMEYCATDPTKFNGFFMVEACDNDGQCATTSVIIELLASGNNAPFFAESLYSAVVEEGVAAGTTIAVSPTLRVNSEGAGDVQYSFFGTAVNMGGALAIDPDTAAITVADASLLDYEKVDTAHCSRFELENECNLRRSVCEFNVEDNACHMKPVKFTVRATDSQGGQHIANLALKIIDVPEAPTDIILTANTLAENAGAGAVIGELLCRDPEVGKTPGQGCTYSLVGSNAGEFKLVQNGSAVMLTSNGDFDFERQSPPVKSVQITATDESGKTSTPMTLDIEIVDVNEKPNNVQLVTVPTFPMNGNSIAIKENTAVGTKLGVLSADDPDADNEDVPACQLTSGSATFSVSNNELVLAAPLDFETKPRVQVSVACIDRPASGGGFNPLISDEASFTFVIENANDAPERLEFVQDTIPKEHSPATGSQKVGTISAIDADAGATEFDMAVADADTWEISGKTCGNIGGEMKCNADLILKRPLDASDAACSVPDVSGNIRCNVFVELTDGTDKTLMRSPSPNVTVIMEDVYDAPSGISLGVSRIESGWKNGHIFGRITIVDMDGSQGPNGRPGHELTLTSSTDDALGLVADGGRRRRVDGVTGYEWRFIVQEERALDLGANPNGIEVEFTVRDLKNPSEPALEFDMALPLVDANTPLGGFESANGVSLANSEVLVPFGYVSTTPLSRTYSLAGEDIALVQLVRLDPDFTGCSTLKWVAKDLNNYELVTASDPNAVGMCEVSEEGSSERGFSAVNLAISADQTSASFRLQPTPYGAAVSKTYGEVVTDLFVKVDKSDGTVSYLLLDVEYLDACGSGKQAVCSVAGEKCELCNLGGAFGSAPAASSECNAADLQSGHVCDAGLSEQLADAQSALDDCLAAEGGDCLAEQAALDTVQQKIALQDANQLVAVKRNILQQCQANGGDCSNQQAALVAAEDAKGEAERSAAATGEAASSGEGVKGWVVFLAVFFPFAFFMLGAYFYLRKMKNEREVAVRKYTKEADDMYGAVYGDGLGPGGADSSVYDDLGVKPFVAGQANPLYDWYCPDINRAMCDTQLNGQGEGAFLVRDSQATQGWHMLAVKRADGSIIHDKIRQHQDGTYELLPSQVDGVPSVPQPRFNQVPEIVEHYLTQRPGVPYKLELANPIYDESQKTAVASVTNPMYTGMAADDATYDGGAVANPVMAASNPMYDAQATQNMQEGEYSA